MKKLIMEEFKKQYRPRGYGEIVVSNDKGEILSYSCVEEVICDVCNKEIVEPEMIWMPNTSWVMCEECGQNYEKKE